MVLQTSRTWLKIHGFLVIICALFTLVLGLDIWFDTLRTRANLLNVWTAQSATVQSLLQVEFNCCGYLNSTSPLFVTDATCTSAFVAATKLGCVSPFSSFANNFLDVVFTGAFGIVGMSSSFLNFLATKILTVYLGIDAFLIIAIAMLLKDREEKERYRHIDLKNGVGGI